METDLKPVWPRNFDGVCVTDDMVVAFCQSGGDPATYYIQKCSTGKEAWKVRIQKDADYKGILVR